MRQEFEYFFNNSELANLLGDSNLVLIDCRFDLKDTDWGHKSYLEGHVPGAVYAHLDHDLSSRITPQTGRHPLPSADEFNLTLSRLGVNQSSQIVAYDTSGGAFAARLWWMLRYFGHPRVAVLNGGFTKWISDNYPFSQGSQQNAASQYHINSQGTRDIPVSTDEIFENLELGKYLLLDARSRERYCGILEPIDAIAGHIPGAINRYHGDNLNPDLTIKPKSQLLHEFKQLLQDVPPENVVVYCGSGVTSCLHILAMEYIGLSGVRLYPGSWSEWIRNSGHPIGKC